MSFDTLSNDAILGLDLQPRSKSNSGQFQFDPLDPLNTHTGFNHNNTTDGTGTVDDTPKFPEALDAATARKRKKAKDSSLRPKSDALKEDVLLSKRGIPKLQSYLKDFKFTKRKSKTVISDSLRRDIRKSSAMKYAEDHHYENLTRLLQIYQAWGHSLSPHLKFERFIDNLSRSVEIPTVRRHLRGLVEEEMRMKMVRQKELEVMEERRKKGINLEDMQLTDEVLRVALGESNSETYHTTINANADANANVNSKGMTPDAQISDEEWPALFGGNGNDNDNADADGEASQIRQPMFSTFLRTSSQPAAAEHAEFSMPFTPSTAVSQVDSDYPEDYTHDDFEEVERDNGADEDAFDALAEIDNGLQDILSDDEQAAEERFSQYLAAGSQSDATKINAQHTDTTPSSGSAPVAPAITQDEDSDFMFSDDDDAVFSALGV